MDVGGLEVNLSNHGQNQLKKGCGSGELTTEIALNHAE